MPSELLDRFREPPRRFSPTPIWWWSADKLQPERLRWQLERFAEGGVYNLVILNLAPTGPLYGSDADDPVFFSEEWWRIFRGVCADAAELGISLWFYDQIGFSGANIQGELVRANPDFAAMELERITRTVEGEVSIECPQAAVPVGGFALPVDSEGQAAGSPVALPVRSGRVTWKDTGTHRVSLVYAVRRGFDYYNHAACQMLLSTIHRQFEQKAGDYLGNVIVGSFQDELPAMPGWSSDFAEEFGQRRGYDILVNLAALWEEYGENSARVRHDYYATRAELSEAAFFKPLFEWHESRGLICGFDQQGPARAGYPVQSEALYADYLKTQRWYGAPGSDHHGEAKIHSSLAHLYNRKRVWIEAFHSSGWGGTLEETFDWLLQWIRAGANLYDPHAVYYSTHGGWWEWAPPSTDWRQPYWRHYKMFSRAVSRLCSVLTLGHHVCDVGILFPTTTVQSDLRQDGPGGSAKAAHEAYLDLVGQMRWYKVEPGLMDQQCRDYDVLDDDSLQRGVVEDGRLVVGDESYKAIVLPACTVIETATALKLVEFVESGGKLAAYKSAPEAGADGYADTLRPLLKLFATGRSSLIQSEQDLRDFLSTVASVVEASVPTLVRRTDSSTILFVPAIFPRATEMKGGGDWVSLYDTGYDFDPARYERTATVTVRGVSGTPLLLEPFSGDIRTARHRETESGVEVEVNFSDSPGMLVVWGDESLAEAILGVADMEHDSGTTVHLDSNWTARLVPTLDNTWGDFSMPAEGAELPFQLWEFRHTVEAGSHAPSDLSSPELDDSSWETVYSTFGAHGIWTGPGALESLPAFGSSSGTSSWREATYSLSRGIHKDTIHRATLGPKGHVPEEFLDFGRVMPGEAVQFRCVVDSPDERDVYLALGAAAAKDIAINGLKSHDDRRYLTIAPMNLRKGANEVEFRLTAEQDGVLRAHFAFVTDAKAYERPEWIRTSSDFSQDSQLRFSRRFTLDAPPTGASVQVGSTVPCSVTVNGALAGVQGGYDPYFSTSQTRVQPYDITQHLRAEENEIAIEATELDPSLVVLVDCLVNTNAGAVSVVSDDRWEVTRNGTTVPVAIRKAQYLDPAWSHLRRRPHPLPGASWLEPEASASNVVLELMPSIPDMEARAEWYRFVLPPGAEKMWLPVRGGVEVYVDGKAVSRPSEEHIPLEVKLPNPHRAGRVCALRIETSPGSNGGAAFEGPILFESSKSSGGMIGLGNWQELGLAGYSGGVEYSQPLTLGEKTGSFILDLGKVRGTAEVRMNGNIAGTRIWSPYRFDVTGLLRPGENIVSVTIYNTLGPYIDAVGPSHFVPPNQRESGLFGPVVLHQY